MEKMYPKVIFTSRSEVLTSGYINWFLPDDGKYAKEVEI
jgi:hypothetical protein